MAAAFRKSSLFVVDFLRLDWGLERYVNGAFLPISICASLFVLDQLLRFSPHLAQFILQLSHEDRDLLKMRVNSIEQQGFWRASLPASHPRRAQGQQQQQAKPERNGNKAEEWDVDDGGGQRDEPAASAH